ncbi:MAG: class IV adenylate cyclase [Treponema sp.]|nr:class IV adenylate cyclase [Treponema sp.]
MTEIELKAHVKDRAGLEERLNQIAAFKMQVLRDDTYYGLTKESRCKIRVRRETLLTGGGEEKKTLLTYKRKEMRTLPDGSSSEVNDEKESEILDADVLEAFLKDSGFLVTLKKQKDVKDWELSVKKEDFLKDAGIDQDLTATFELCNVPPLGDFLEIEILSPVDTPRVVEALQKKLHELLALVGIGEDQIENRYYSELLRAREAYAVV